MKKILFLTIAVFMFAACSDNLTDLNVDTKNPQEVPAANLIANATVELFDIMSTASVNENNFRLWAQHWAQTTYPDESNYELVERNVNGRMWNTMYATILRDLKEARQIIEADANTVVEVKANQFAILDVMEVVAYTHMVDIFGDVPFTEALTDDSSPAYDDDAAIYDAMITKLDAATKNLNGDSGLGSADFIYGGDGNAWKTFANSYMLRLAVRLADSNPGKAQGMAEAAVAGGVFASNADNFTIQFEGSPPNTNPLWEQLVQSGRSDFVASNTMVDYMVGLSDPRIGTFFKNQIMVVDTIAMDTSFIWQGGTFGASNGYATNSQPGSILESETLPGTIMGYTEVAFLLADANERGWNVGGSAAAWYDIGVANSIMEWGGDEATANAYLAQPNVAYDSAPGNWKEKIAMQKWIALYNQGFEAWTTYRIYDAPVMNVADGAGTTPPFRYTYPTTEFSLNGDNVQAAGAAMGGDDLFSRVFWDVN